MVDSNMGSDLCSEHRRWLYSPMCSLLLILIKKGLRTSR